MEKNYIEEIVKEDLAAGIFSRPVTTRFAPEPGGFLHIGHAKGILASWKIARKFEGFFNLRMDDTDPEKDHGRYVDIVIDDVKMLGVDPGDRVFFASDYFNELYEYAADLIDKGKAYVCDLSEDELKTYRGDYFRPGRPSPYRNRSSEENSTLLEQMRAGRFQDGAKTLRAKVDYNAPNVLMRDPVMYRVLHKTHYRTGDRWCIYPMYDFAHCLSDYIEGVTHSLCGLEFENHRCLYDWFPDAAGIDEPPKQIEYAELNMSRTVLGKRHIRKLISLGIVSGWDDPGLMTLKGLKRRGYSAEVFKLFFDRIGLSRTRSRIAPDILEACARDYYNTTASRAMAVLNPLKVRITNYPKDTIEYLEAINNPEKPELGTREVPFGRDIYIERDDFMATPVKKYYRLTPGREVRLRYGYFITCKDFTISRETGEVVEVFAEYDPATRGGFAPDGRKVKSTLHWVSVEHSIPAEIREFNQLTDLEDSSAGPSGEDLTAHIDPHYKTVVEGARLEPMLAHADPDTVYQFERLGYFCADPDSSPRRPVFNKTASLRDSWAKVRNRP